MAQRGDTHNGGTDEKYPSGRRAHLTSDVRRTASRRSMLCRTLSLPVLTSAGPRPPCLHSWGTFRACPPELRPLTAKFHSRLTTNLRRQILTTNLQTPYLTCGESDGHRTHSGWLQGMHLALYFTELLVISLTGFSLRIPAPEQARSTVKKLVGQVASKS